MPKYKATAYIRLSYTDDHSSESDSVSNQRKLIENFVEHNPDIEVVSEKIDDGYSGIIFDRPAFKEMMQDVTDGNINCVIVKDLSRLGREYIETGRYLRRVFPAYGVRFIAITDSIDTAHDSGDDLTVSVKNIMNEAYCRDISIKTRSSLDVKRRNGDFVAAFPVYGYMKAEDNKNLLVPDPYAARVVCDIFRMRLEGASASKIASELNRLGILSPLAYKKNNGLPYAKNGYADKADCKWSATTIIRILQDETYTGTLVQGKQGTPHYKIKQMEQRPASEWVRVPDAHEALIARQDFELVQRIKGLDTRTSPNEDTVYLFSGILICGCCGNRMTRKTNRANGKEYHYYYCPTGKKKGCTHPVMLKESSLIDCVRDSLKAYIGNIASLEALLTGIDQTSINQALTKEYSDHITDNERRLEQVLEFKARLYESLVGGMLTKEEYASYKAKYTKQAEDIRESVRVLKEKLTDVLENRSERNRWISQFTQFSTLETLDRRALIHMVQSIRVRGKKELDITFTIAVRLNEAGILTPSHYKKMQGKITHENLLGSGKWQTRTVGVILRSEVYTGDLVQGQTKTVDHRQVKADAEEWTVVRDTHEAIISREQFAAVQEILNQTASRAKAREVKAFTPNLLKGKVFCAHCGGSLHRQRNIRKKSDDVYFYHCLSQSRISKNACPGVTIREDALLDMLADMLQDALDTALGQYTLSLAEQPRQADDRTALREKITSRKQEIQRFRGIVRSLYENLVQGVLTKDEYFDYKEKYESRIADLAVEMEQLEDGLRTMDAQAEQHRALEQDAAQIKTDRALTGALIERLIDRIEVSHDKQITVRYRFQSEFETYAEVLEQCRNM